MKVQTMLKKAAAVYGEMALKGLNKKTFEDMLIKNIKRRLKPLGHFQMTSAQSTTYITPLDEDIDLNEVADRVGKIFGIATYCRACVCEKDFDDICNKSYEYLDEVLSCARTFKVNAKRSDKAFPMKSPEICMELGGKLLERFPHLTVDVRNPEVTVTVEIRDENAFVHAENIKGAGGLPVGSSGKAMLLLSGGIDSPVAGYMMAKRGVHPGIIGEASGTALLLLTAEELIGPAVQYRALFGVVFCEDIAVFFSLLVSEHYRAEHCKLAAEDAFLHYVRALDI